MDPNGEETFKFTSSVVGGAIPKEYIPAVGEGIEEATKAGILGGFPVLGVAADVYDGSYHEVDSSEMAFHIAGSMAFKDAMAKGNPVLLEPIMKVEVTMPEEYMGDVIGDVNARRGRIEGTPHSLRYHSCYRKSVYCEDSISASMMSNFCTLKVRFLLDDQGHQSDRKTIVQ